MGCEVAENDQFYEADWDQIHGSSSDSMTQVAVGELLRTGDIQPQFATSKDEICSPPRAALVELDRQNIEPRRLLSARSTDEKQEQHGARRIGGGRYR